MILFGVLYTENTFEGLKKHFNYKTSTLPEFKMSVWHTKMSYDNERG